MHGLRVQLQIGLVNRKGKTMTLFEYGNSVLEAWDDFIEALLYSSPIGRFAKRIVERNR